MTDAEVKALRARVRKLEQLVAALLRLLAPFPIQWDARNPRMDRIRRLREQLYPPDPT